jgi:hypothetical protein
LSLGALVEESLSTRLDSVRAPDRLCVDEERLDPDDRLRELERDREDDPLFDFFEEVDFFEELPPERLLLLDRDFCLGILPGVLLELDGSVSGSYPNPAVQTTTQPAIQTVQNRSSNPCTAGKSRWTAGAKGAAGKEAKRAREAINHGPDNAILEQPVNSQPLDFEQIEEQKRLFRQFPVEFQSKQFDQGTVGGIAAQRRSGLAAQVRGHEGSPNGTERHHLEGRREGRRARLKGEDPAGSGWSCHRRDRRRRGAEEPQRLAATAEGAA